MDTTNKRHGTEAIPGTLWLLSTIRSEICQYRRTAASTYWGCGTKGKRKTTTSTVPPWKWTDECEAAFNELKNALTDEPLLGNPDFRRPYILEIDASFRGLCAVLSQEQDGKVVVLSYASRTLRPAERNMDNYSTMKLEMPGLKWAVTEKFRDYLLGSECTVYTDNNPLSYLQTSARLGATEMSCRVGTVPIEH